MSQTNPKSIAYERMVKAVLETKLAQDGLGTFQAFHLKKYKGRSNQEHEIDVSFEIKIGDLELLFLVECKEYRRKVGIDDIMSFSYRLKDIGAHKGLLVTNSGFQAGAVKVANSERIALLVIAEGRLVGSWLGLIGKFQTFWTCKLEFALSEGGLDVNLIGRRHVACNSIWTHVPLSAEDDSSQEKQGIIYFLFPEEVEEPGFISRFLGRRRLDDAAGYTKFII